MSMAVVEVRRRRRRVREGSDVKFANLLFCLSSEMDPNQIYRQFFNFGGGGGGCGGGGQGDSGFVFQF